MICAASSSTYNIVRMAIFDTQILPFLGSTALFQILIRYVNGETL